MDDCTSNLDGNDNIDVIDMDFQKAFESVPHERLLKKLYSYGIQGNLLGWIIPSEQEAKSSFIWSSILYCNSNKRNSSRKRLGTSPIYIYINDLQDVVHNTTKLFADDAKIYSVVNHVNDQDDLQNDLKQFDNWSQD